MNLPRWKCHKEVEAVKIEGSRDLGDKVALIWFPGPNQNAEIIVSLEYINRHKPQAGGYYVRYDDGYESYSPAKAFEEGYTRIS